MPSRLNFLTAKLRKRTHQHRRACVRRTKHALLQPLVEAPEDGRRDVVQRDPRHAREGGEVPLEVRVQEVVQLCRELHARRSSTDDTEV